MATNAKFPRVAQTHNCDYNIMLIGVAGGGKSTACNFYFGKKVFQTKGIVTAKSEIHCDDILESKVLLIDTPGFTHTDEKYLQEIAEALNCEEDGVHAVGICLDGSRRYDTACDEFVNQLSSLDRLWSHAFVLYTHADDLGDTEQERKEQVLGWLRHERCPKGLRSLLENVKLRCITVESKSKDKEYHKEKCKELLSLVSNIYEENSRKMYNGMFKETMQNVDKVHEELKASSDQFIDKKADHETKAELKNDKEVLLKVHEKAEQKRTQQNFAQPDRVNYFKWCSIV